MAKKPETTFRTKVRRDLKLLKSRFPVFFEAIQQRAIRGSPDFLICMKGDFFALELKKDEKEEPTKLQEKKLNDITKAGGVSIVAHPGNWDNVYQLLCDYNIEDNHGIDQEADGNRSTTQTHPLIEGDSSGSSRQVLKN